LVPEIVLVETVWVLARSYKLKRSEAAQALRRLLATNFLVLESEELVSQALLAFEQGKADFSDYLIREHARAAGATPIYSFDETLADDKDFERP